MLWQWFYDLPLVLVLTCHKKIKNSLILAYSAAASHTSLRSADSHSDWGVEKNNPCWTVMWRGVNWRTNPRLLPLFFSPFPFPSQCLPFSRPLWWDPLFCFLLFVWVAWKPWQLSSWEGFFSFYWCGWGSGGGCWKVTRSAYGWDALQFLCWHFDIWPKVIWLVLLFNLKIMCKQQYLTVIHTIKMIQLTNFLFLFIFVFITVIIIKCSYFAQVLCAPAHILP